MAQHLGAFVVLTEDPGLCPSTYIADNCLKLQFKKIQFPCWAPALLTHGTQTYIQAKHPHVLSKGKHLKVIYKPG